MVKTTEKRFVRVCDIHYKPVNNNQTGESYTIDELIKLLNELTEENQQLRTLNYVNKEAVRLNNIKYVQIGKENVDCSKIDWKLLYGLYKNMIDYYYNEILE